MEIKRGGGEKPSRLHVVEVFVQVFEKRADDDDVLWQNRVGKDRGS